MREACWWRQQPAQLSDAVGLCPPAGVQLLTAPTLVRVATAVAALVAQQAAAHEELLAERARSAALTEQQRQMQEHLTMALTQLGAAEQVQGALEQVSSWGAHVDGPARAPLRSGAC